jgi:hypothetical protein
MRAAARLDTRQRSLAGALPTAPPPCRPGAPPPPLADVHNRVEETSPTSGGCGAAAAARGVCLGGWARIATAVRWARGTAAAEGAAGFLFLVGAR